MKKIDEKLMIFDRLMYIGRRTRNNEVGQIENWRILGFRWKFTVLVKYNPQYRGYKNRVDFENQVLNSQEGYGQTLLVFD